MASITKRTIRWTTQGGEPRTTEKYEAGYRDRTGKRHRRLFVLKKEARRWLDEQTAGLVTGQWADPRAGRESVRAYGERWLKRQVLADSTASTYGTILSNHILPTFGAMRMDAINRADVQSLVKEWEGSAAARTVEARYSILAIMLRAAVKDGVIPATPCVDIKRPKIEAKSALVPISTETVFALRDEMPERYRAFVTIAAGTGMRRGEILGLTLDRIALDFGTIRVDRQLARSSRAGNPVWGLPKTESSTRTIPVAGVVVAAIKQHVKDFGQHESGLLFTTDLGAFVGTSTLHGAWQRAARKVGTNATPHDLRHYFASVQIRGGQSIKVLQALLGHKSAVETWDTYGHLMGDEDDRSRAVIDAALDGRVPRVTSAAAGDRSGQRGTSVVQEVSTVEPQ
ncbi:site-specific integrase [soil metagenome]